jgi:hypothetical protein
MLPGFFYAYATASVIIEDALHLQGMGSLLRFSLSNTTHTRHACGLFLYDLRAFVL